MAEINLEIEKYPKCTRCSGPDPTGVLIPVKVTKAGNIVWKCTSCEETLAPEEQEWGKS